MVAVALAPRWWSWSGSANGSPFCSARLPRASSCSDLLLVIWGDGTCSRQGS